MKFDDLNADIKRWGWKRSLLTRLMWKLHTYAGLDVYWVFTRRLEHRPEPTLPAGLALRVARADELFRATGDPEIGMSTDFVREALGRGDMAFGAFDGDRLVSYTWRTFTAAPHADGLWAKVERPCVYGYKALTLPSYRGKRIQAAVSIFSDTHLLDRGYTDLVAFVEIFNFSSLDLQKYLGSRKIGHAGYLMWFGRPVPFRARAVKKIGFKFEFRK